MLLWAASWHQVPAASLPNNDRTLAQLAGFGRYVEQWQAVRDDALRGFVECSDGRLYHRVVAEKAREAWEMKKKHAVRMENMRAAKSQRKQAPGSLQETTQESLQETSPRVDRDRDIDRDRDSKERGSAPNAPKEKISASAKTVFSEGWALDADAMRIAADNGFGENETAQLAAEHREHVEANMPGTTRTAKAWGDLWRRRCETISADAKAPAGLRKRVARANAKPAQVAIDPTWPHWWQQAARALGEAHQVRQHR